VHFEFGGDYCFFRDSLWLYTTKLFSEITMWGKIQDGDGDRAVDLVS
jgi:hypothetical protein